MTTSFWIARPWNNQYGKPLDGICTPYCVTLPDASLTVSFLAMSTISAQVDGGLFGSSPAALNSSLL